jgi:hypothetical protein
MYQMKNHDLVGHICFLSYVMPIFLSVLNFTKLIFSLLSNIYWNLVVNLKAASSVTHSIVARLLLNCHIAYPILKFNKM